MKRRPFNRRTLLRGMLAGAGVAVALPALEAMLNGNGDAYADGSGFPKRFGWWFFGNGVHPDQWVPEKSGEDWELSPQLAPLAPNKDYVTAVSGLKVYHVNSVPHGSGPAGILTGSPLGKAGDNFGSSTFGAKTLDQIYADAVGNETRFKSLELAIERTDKTLSYSGSGEGAANAPQHNPTEVFNRLFGNGFVEPGDTPIIDPKLGLRRSVLDAIGTDAQELQKRLGQSDKQRIEQHFTNIRTLEKQLAKLEEDPPNLAGCKKPNSPLADYPDEGGIPQLKAINEVMSDMLAMALACDLTRSFSVMFSRPLSNLLYSGNTAGHHQLTHDEVGDQPMVNKIVVESMAGLNYFLSAMRKVTEGSETLLDHSALLVFSDCSYGKSHAIDNYPLLMCGGASGRLKKGYHYQSPAAENASKLGFSILRMLDIPATEFGVKEFKGPGQGKAEPDVTEGLDAIEA